MDGFQRWVDYARRRLDPAECRQVEAELAEVAPEPADFAALLGRLQAISARVEPPGPDLFPLEPVRAGVRGGGATRMRSYRGDRCVVDVSVTLEKRPDLYSVIGQVSYEAGSQQLEGRKVELLSQRGDRIEVATLNAQGEFILSCRLSGPSVVLALPPERLRLELPLGP